MLTRINTALIKFLTPVAIPMEPNVHSKWQGQEQPRNFQRYKKNEQPSSSVSSVREETPSSSPNLRLIKSEVSFPKKEPHSSLEMLELISILKNSIKLSSRADGLKTYRSALRIQRKQGKSRKGSIFDQQSD